MAEVLGAVTTATKFFFEVILLKQSCHSNPSFLNIPQVNQISIDNWSFKCFYKITTSILLTCSLMSTTKQFFGEPIQCDLVRDRTVSMALSYYDIHAERWRGQPGSAEQLLLDVLLI